MYKKNTNGEQKMTAIEVVYVGWQLFLMSAALAAGILTGEILKEVIN